jgi:hypothetical protein
MALKNVIKPYHLMTDGDMSGNLTSNTVDVTYSDNVGIQLTWTGAAVGTFAVEGTVDESNWSSLSFSSTPSASGGGDTHLLNLNNLPYKRIRVKYTRTSSTGTLQVWVMAKTMGG